MAKILIVDDELTIIEVLKKLLSKSGYSVSTSLNGNDALNKLKEEVFDLMITDVRLPGIDGITLLQRGRELQSHLAIIVMTAYSDVEPAVAAMKNGAFDYVIKPFNFEELMITIQRALSYEMALAENEVLKSTLTANYHFDLLVGDSEPMLKVYRLIEKVAKTTSTVLILGGSGTGKELVAKSLHNSSPRHDGPFVVVNCAAMPETLLESELFGYVKGSFTGANTNKKGLFETASGGTIFLDEISAIPLSMQVKLLRVLQEKEIRRVGGTENIPIDIRVLAASNENLEDKIKKGEFRDVLYYRLSVIPIEIPPLRERIEDIPLLVAHFLEEFEIENKQSVAISKESLKAFMSYKWPGNVRELENMLKRVATLCENNTIQLSDLPESILSSMKEKERKKDELKFDEADRNASKIFRKNINKVKKGFNDEK
ncbi:MAG: sigma-54 dependent transcriptional regulator [Victivallales bacterium]